MKKILISAAMLLASNVAIQAQIEEDYEGDEDEITVTDDNGKEEVIEFPEAMTFELDSLLNLYMSKNYLGEDNDCRMKDINPVFEKEVCISTGSSAYRASSKCHTMRWYRNSSTAIADVCATPLVICLERRTSTCRYSRRLSKHTDCLSN